MKGSVWPIPTILLKIVYAAFFVFPIAFTVLTSFRPWSAIESNSLFFTPTLDNYINLFGKGLGQYNFGKFLTNSLIIASTATIVGAIIGIPAAYSLSRLRAPNLGVFFLSFRFLPAVSVVIPIFVQYRTLGLLDTYQGLSFVYLIIVVPYVVWMMKVYFDEVPDEIFQAAKIDGYSDLDIAFKILLPACLPGFLVTVWISFMFCWNEFFIALVLTRYMVQTAPVSISFFIGGMGRATDWGPLTAAGFLMSLPLFVFLIFAQRYFVKALTFGLLK